jgi:hypothetical protein
VGMKFCIAIIENNVKVAQKNYQITQKYYSCIYFYNIWNQYTKRYLLSHIYDSIIHDSQGMESFLVTINW